MLFICYGLWKALRDEVALTTSAGLQAAPLIPREEASLLWRRRLSAIVSHPRQQQVAAFIEGTVAKAFDAVIAEMDKRELAATVQRIEDGLCLTVGHGDGVTPFIYEVRPVSRPLPSFALTDAGRAKGGRDRYYRAEVFLTQGSRGYDIFGYDVEQVIADVINHYDRFRHYLSLTAWTRQWHRT